MINIGRGHAECIPYSHNTAAYGYRIDRRSRRARLSSIPLMSFHVSLLPILISLVSILISRHRVGTYLAAKGMMMLELAALYDLPSSGHYWRILRGYNGYVRRYGIRIRLSIRPYSTPTYLLNAYRTTHPPTSHPSPSLPPFLS